MCGSSLPHAKVSVIVASYNQVGFLRLAIDSILRQTFEDFEVIVVDDGSVDGSIEIIEELAGLHPKKIRFYHHPRRKNCGICATYTLGIQKAKGDYLAFMEGDDFWETGFLKRKVDLLNRHQDIGVVFSPYKIVSSGFYGFDMTVRQWFLGLFMPENFPFNNLKNLMKKNNVATFSAFMTRKSLLGRVSLAPPPGTLFFDWWILFQLGLHTNFYLDTSNRIHWRHHHASALGKQKMEQHIAMLCRFMQAMYEEIGRNIDHIDERNRIRYLKNRSILPKFILFYQQPNIRRFLTFFRFSPLWAVESLASFFINYWKHTR